MARTIVKVYASAEERAAAAELELAGQKMNICQDGSHVTNDVPTCSARAN